MQITTLPDDQRDAAVALWHACGLTRPWNDPDADLARALAGPASTVLGALDGETLVGTAMVGHDGHRGWVYYVAVDPGRQRTGLGRQLMAAAEAWLDERGVPKVQLMVRAGNDAVVGFYEALGYTDQGVVTMGRFLDPALEARRRVG